MKTDKIWHRVKEIIGAKKGKPFMIATIEKQLIAEGYTFRKQTLQGIISRDFVHEGFVEKVGNKGAAGIYEGPKKMKKAVSKKVINQVLLRGMSGAVRDYIKNTDDVFTIADVAEHLTAKKIPFKLKNLRNTISNKMIRQGFVVKTGTEGRVMLYQRADAVQPEPKQAQADPVPQEPEKKKTEPEKAPEEKTGPRLLTHIREIIAAYKGSNFIVQDVFDDLEDNGVDFAQGTVGSLISLERKAGRIQQVGKKGLAYLYRQTPEDEVVAPPPEPPRFSDILYAVAAGLLKFSTNYLATEIEKVGPYTLEQALKKLPSVLHRLKGKEHLTKTPTRPAVYTMTPDYYIANLSKMPAFAETAPHLEERILRNFGDHCSSQDQEEPKEEPKPQEETQPAPTASVADPVPDVPVPDGLSPAVLKVALSLDKIFRQVAKASAEHQNKAIIYSLEDKGQALVNATNRIRSLESQNRKLSERLDRLTHVVDEKNRINAALQKRLNDALHGSKRPGASAGGSFALAELLHVEGKAIVDSIVEETATVVASGRGGK